MTKPARLGSVDHSRHARGADAPSERTGGHGL